MLRLWTPITAVALAIATLFSLALLVLALTFPVYGMASESSSVGSGGAETSEVTTSTGTLVSVNGYGALLLVAVPLVATLLVGLLVRRGSSVPEYVVAWVLTALYLALCVLALMSIGIFLAPVGLALVLACAMARVGELREVAPV